MKKLDSGKIVIFLFLPFILLGEVKAGEYYPPPSVTVSSIYWDPVSNIWGNQVEWMFARSDSAGDSFSLEVKKKGDDTPTMLLHYGITGELRGSERFPMQGGQRLRLAETFTEKLVLSEGFPVPYDYLAPDDVDLKKVVIKKQTGGAVFSSQVEREIVPVSLTQALRDGMVTEEIRNMVSGRNLKLIKAIKNEQIMVQQLWAEGIPWWIYEETPYRKSWLTKISLQN